MFCEKCGAAIPHGYSFCSECGAPAPNLSEYDTSANSESNNNAVNSQVREADQPVDNVQPVPETVNTVERSTDSKETSKKIGKVIFEWFKGLSKKKKIIVIVIVLIVLSLLFSKTKNNGSDEKIRPTETATAVSLSEAESFEGLNIAEAEEKSMGSKYIVKYLDDITGNSLDEEIKNMSEEEKKLWVVKDASADSESGNTVKLSFVYTGEKKMPDVTGENLTAAESKLKSEKFSNLKYVSDNGKMVIMTDNWTVISQSVKAGEKCRANEQIVLTCKPVKTAEEKEEVKEESGEEGEKPKRTGIDPEFKEFWDSYYEFMKSYSELIDDPDANPVKYAQVMIKYNEFLEKADYYENDYDITEKELIYMNETIAKINALL